MSKLDFCTYCLRQKNSEVQNYTGASLFRLFIVELLLSDEGYLPKVYEKVDAMCRLFILDSLHSIVSTDSNTSVPVTSILFLVRQFKDCCDCILKTCEKYVEVLEPVEVSKLLQLLASVSASSKYQSELQRDSSLLITCSSKLILSSFFKTLLLGRIRDT